MSINNRYKLSIEYQTNHGMVFVIWNSGFDIKVDFAEKPALNFEIPTYISGLDFSTVEPSIRSLHREAMLELLLRIPDIYFQSGCFHSDISGELTLVLDRRDSSDDLVSF